MDIEKFTNQNWLKIHISSHILNSKEICIISLEKQWMFSTDTNKNSVWITHVASKPSHFSTCVCHRGLKKGLGMLSMHTLPPNYRPSPTFQHSKREIQSQRSVHYAISLFTFKNNLHWKTQSLILLYQNNENKMNEKNCKSHTKEFLFKFLCLHG